MNSFSGSVKPVTVEGTKKILEQMTNCICKIKNNQKIGTGFFCRIPYKNNSKIDVLITSYQIIDQYYLNNNNQINLLINDFNESKIINIDPNWKIYFSEQYNTTIIELKENDYITDFIELDDNLFSNNINSLFENQSIYILHYLNGGKALVSYGILNNINHYNIKHNCNTEFGSNGEPILNLSTNKVIGITFYSQNNYNNFNQGIILKYSIEEFLNRFNNINNNQQVNPNFFNNNLPGFAMNNNAFIPNFIPFNNNNFVPNMMINNNNFQIMNMNNNNFVPIEKPKINVIFQTIWGTVNSITVDFGVTINQLLKKYFERIGRPELIRQDNTINFTFNARKIKFDDETPVEKYFAGVLWSKVFVSTNDDIHTNINQWWKWVYS